jgi:hypothetical protein
VLRERRHKPLSERGPKPFGHVGTYCTLEKHIVCVYNIYIYIYTHSNNMVRRTRVGWRRGASQGGACGSLLFRRGARDE